MIYDMSMKVVVTGASGFLGSWISRILSYENNVIALVQEKSSTRNLDGIKNIEIIRDDVFNWPHLIREKAPTTLILSDWWGVGNVHRNDPKQFDNLDRFQALVESAISANVRNILGVGSQAELGPVSETIFENQIDAPTTLYGVAKVNARKILFDLVKDTNSRATWMRIFSTYGPLDNGNWLIPNTIDALSSGEEIKLTLGLQQWSYLHAFDLGVAFSKIVNNPEVNGIINVGNPETSTIREVTQLIGRFFSKSELLNYGSIPYRPDQVMQMKPACETLMELGWTPKVGIDEGITQTIQWNLGWKSNQLTAATNLGMTIDLPGKELGTKNF
jgi:nucleoside-diphosphate-sugar epimerase